MGDQPTSDPKRTPEDVTAESKPPVGEQTQVIPKLEPAKPVGEQTQVIPKLPPEKPVGEQTQVIPKPQPAKPAGEETVIIRLPGVDSVPLAGRTPRPDDTAIISLPAGGVRKRPAGDDTVIIRLPQGPKSQSGKAKPRGSAPVTEPADDTVIIKLPHKEPKERAAAPAVVVEDDPAATSAGLGYAPWVLLLSSLGVVLVAMAYVGGRAGNDVALTAYWTGQVIVFTPVVFRLLSRMPGATESFVLVIGLAANQYMLKWMYSPDQFRFPDELQHWLATTLITETGELFRPNAALPPAVHFPGLAEMGAALAELTGLPVTAAGILVAGVTHLVFVGLLFVTVLRASNSPAMAGVTCVTYATAMHYLFFNSMFLYQTAALPFFMMTIWASRRWRTGGGRRFLVLGSVGAVMTTVSHHVTAFALVATLVLLAGTELAMRRPRPWNALILPGVSLIVVLGWILFVAHDVIAYLESPAQRMIASLRTMFGGAAGADSSASVPVPLIQLAVQGLGLLGLLVLFLAVARDMILRRDRDVWRWAALIGGAVFFAGNGARFLGTNGPEIAGRLSTFTYIPISMVAASAIVYAVQIIPPKDEHGRRWRSALVPGYSITTGRRLSQQVWLGTALITILMIGARTGGYPPVSALLPGDYLPAAYERSVDAYGVEAAYWQKRTLGPGNRVGGDLTAVALSSTYGRQDPVREVGELFYARTWGTAQGRLAEAFGLDYLVVDERLGDALPAEGAYFEADPNAGRITEPLTAAQLGKFDTAAGLSRLYDNGNVRIYQMGTS
ncbi:hypothetical protein ACTOB_002819 [Actinoplanes oblitus]|uniref:Glycosyltransferase RgtA/B/C/D-like domain-containing protein n=1 Tax=Actinoplanes oblitus TaxID=3040509 RepID=A0ABY8WMU7_9ACTN|nr:hypothetical protein [Actinoplanes oblitus]WIM99175.1 hypothetical protein ACTOB_002819 [Actinoplanes oblitus]